MLQKIPKRQALKAVFLRRTCSWLKLNTVKYISMSVDGVIDGIL